MGEWIAAAGAAIYGALSSAAAGASAAVGGTAAAGGAAAGGAAAAGGTAAASGAAIGSSMMGGLTAASATTAAATGAGMVGTGGMTMAGAGTLGGALLKAAVPIALSVGADMASKALTKPDMPGAPPPVAPNTYGKDSVTPAKIAEPSAPPTEGVASSNAFKAEERRRLLAGMPQATQNIFSSPGGDQSGARLRKPRLLGGGVGQTTTGV